MLVNTAATQSTTRKKESTAPLPTTGTITLTARDVNTGYAVLATVAYGPIDGDFSLSFSGKSDSEGRIRLTLPVGTYLFEMCASGYQSARSYQPVTSRSAMTFEMDSTNPAPEMRPEVLDAHLRPGYAMVFGYVVDDSTAKPLANVRVSLQQSGVETRTNARGYYALFAKVTGDPNSPPPTDTLVAEVPRYKTLIHQRLPLYGGQWESENIAVSRGKGLDETNFSARWMPGDSEEHQPQDSTAETHPISPKLLEWLSVPSRPCHSRETGKPMLTLGHTLL